MENMGKMTEIFGKGWKSFRKGGKGASWGFENIWEKSGKSLRGMMENVDEKGWKTNSENCGKWSKTSK